MGGREGFFSLSRKHFMNMMAVARNGRFLSTDSTKVNKPFKVEEGETVNSPPPPLEKVVNGLLVLGGNGFVGSHVCKEALDRGLAVASLSSGLVGIYKRIMGQQCDLASRNLLSDDSWKEALSGVTSVIISCVGGFGSNSCMYKINGTANTNAIRAAAEKGVKRFVYISAADFGVVNYLLKGYYEGKSVILRPGFIHRTCPVGSMKLPLGVIGSPLEMVLQYAKPLNQVPLVGPLLTPPVHVTSVAKVAIRAATDPVFPPGIINVYGILVTANRSQHRFCCCRGFLFFFFQMTVR
ncbi:unnamed protein product [Camellia sinensis]